MVDRRTMEYDSRGLVGLGPWVGLLLAKRGFWVSAGSAALNRSRSSPSAWYEARIDVVLMTEYDSAGSARFRPKKVRPRARARGRLEPS